MGAFKLTLKEKTTIILLSIGNYQTPNYVIRHVGKATTGWNYRLSEQGYTKSVNRLYGLEAVWTLTEVGCTALLSITPREVYRAKDRLRRMGYHLLGDPMVEW